MAGRLEGDVTVTLYVGQILSRWMRMNLGGGLGRHGGRVLIS
jgi:hypothetical protein